ncbi:MAG: serine/threonine protein kinase [Candidatus Eremiobacteraeota bacterium]|nr:serine/threonine protein kinase [Candidatus Eremiobacteraeota bacterium]MCW5871301.1 serine/threonine protein kinase [Candidatus Eremiobacteraeota bacterium]
MNHEVGAVLQDRYEIEAAIGQGGMGAVYRARDLQTEQIVAVKQLRPDASAGFESKEMLARFDNEWQLLRTLNHPRIPRMLDAFRIEECGYYVMEFIEGQSLDQVLRGYKSAGRRFPEELLLQYSLQILDVLEYLHGLPKGLLHRDIKPQNIIVREADGELFLVDFGLAREGGSATTKTLVGTLGYAPLEQVKGHPEPRSDLYALGATMYHMLVGEQPAPFDIPPIATVRNDIHPALAEVVDRACQDNVNRRYANARKMEFAARQALQALTGQQGGERYEQLYLEETPEVVYQTARPLDAREFLLRAALASASLLLLMVVLYRIQHLLKSKAPGPKVAVTETASPDVAFTPGENFPVRSGPPAPPLEVISGAGQRIQLSPAGPEQVNLLPLSPNWRLAGYSGLLGPGTLQAPAGGAAAVMLERGGPVRISHLRLSLARPQGPVNLQVGLFAGGSLLVGVVSTLERDDYYTSLQSEGASSQDLRCGWQQGISQQLDLSYFAGHWVLRDVVQNAEVKVAGRDNQIDHLQLVLPAARQAQILGVNSLSVTEE